MYHYFFIDIALILGGIAGMTYEKTLCLVSFLLLTTFFTLESNFTYVRMWKDMIFKQLLDIR